jgi:hypothetical protein
MTENKKLRKRKSKKPYDSMSITTGDIGLNINRFNQAFGTADLGSADANSCGGTALSEAKRYVRRYYIRPQNIFCSNKAEIIKALIELDDANCSVYTLNNLGDDKDVNKLMNSDIIYYYDDGILYDKNRVKVMDYDLSIKKEEERKHFANVDKATDKEFKVEYEDRMTDATELEENMSSLLPIFNDCDYDVIDADYTAQGEVIVSLNHSISDIEVAAEELASCLEKHGMYVIDWNTNGSNVFIFELGPDNAFDMDFEDINVFGESLKEAKERVCCKCGEPLIGDEQLTDDGLACNGCYLHFYMGG